jgi:hypothetical protein
MLALGCSNIFEPETGSLAVKLILPQHGNGLQQLLDPTVTIHIKLIPGDRIETFQFDAHSGVIGGIAPGTCRVEVTGYDANNVYTIGGSEDGVVVREGKETLVLITLT